MPDVDAKSPLALDGLKVIDCATLFAGPVIATLLGDYGARVIKVEHPKGDSLRSLGRHKDGVPLWWSFISRNKECITANMGSPEGAEVVRRLVSDADVFIENFRPGTLERWGLGPDSLLEINPGLIIVRMTGFGQTGPYSSRPGYGTLAEAMSGFAHINGHADGPPTLPPLALGDSVAALAGAFATLTALWSRQKTGMGQVVDLSIFEPLFWILGPQVTEFTQLGVEQGRDGNRSPFSSPRNAYQAKDGVWLAISGSSQSTAERTMRAIGAEDIICEPWFADNQGRMAHVDEIDDRIASWVAQRSSQEALRVFEKAEAAVTPVLSISDIVAHEHYAAREAIISVPHPALGQIQMQNMIANLTRTPGRIVHPGREIGYDTERVLISLGYSPGDIDLMRSHGAI